MPDYHFIITVQKPDPRGGYAVADWSGFLTPEPDWSRHETYKAIRRAFEQRHPDLVGGNVMFFSLEPNTL
ncbi:hypothetical protein ACFWMT_07230 [Streptomyces sp. NPDC058368]|uniref:hypothetical protein n=1 Tax=Streptomyces sp. NPDC058368 TaxID=3346461 RepID=UPI0036642D85